MIKNPKQNKIGLKTETNRAYGVHLNIWSKATFIPNICGILSILLFYYTLEENIYTCNKPI